VGSTLIHHLTALPALAGRRQSEYAVPAAIRGKYGPSLFYLIIIIIIIIIGYNTLITEVLRAVLRARL
jgi:hypothetical protein